jgi:hypothetical protein
MALRPYYFGVAVGDQAGHHLYGEDGFWPKRPEREELPFTLARLDGEFCPNVTRQEGVAKITWENGWTILSFWDQSGDHRPGSHSTFLFPGVLRFEQIETEAARVFPKIWARALARFTLEPMCCSICRGPTGYEMEGLYEFVCDGCN